MRYLETSGTQYPVTQPHIPEEQIPHPKCCENLKNLQHWLPPTAFIYIIKSGSTLGTLPRIVTPYRDSVDETRDSVT
jgi:hypothetical protein